MIEKVVKKAFGYYKEVRDFEDFTHVIYDAAAYHKSEQEKQALRDGMKQLQRDFENKCREVDREASKKIGEAKESAAERIAAAMEETRQHKQRADKYENLNENLIRISKERANSKRNLSPKKQHCGYVLLNVEQVFVNYKDNSLKRPDLVQLSCWRIRMQTPYEILIKYQSAKDLIYKDLMSNFGARIGIETVFDNNLLKTSDTGEINELWRSKENFIFKTYYKANAIKGFWEVEYYARRMIDILPEMIIDK